MASGVLSSALLFGSATFFIGLGAGLFGHGTLTATMRAAPRDRIGLALGAWGAVQTTAAGLAIALGGVIRDVLLAVDGGSAAIPYAAVFAVEAALLLAALTVARITMQRRLDARPDAARFSSDETAIQGGLGLTTSPRLKGAP
jgi:BCD family chlorophyll transporter-like MFS transporter